MKKIKKLTLLTLMLCFCNCAFAQAYLLHDLNKVTLISNSINLAQNQNIINPTIQEHAPVKVYKLIKREWGIPKEKKEDMKIILDLIWSEKNGRMFLQMLAENKIPIRIVRASSKAQTIHTQQTTTFYNSGMGAGGITYAAQYIPGNSLTTYFTDIKIPITYINNFNNPNLSLPQRLYNLMVFIHEFGHAFMLANDNNNKNSIEEEIGVSMIGYNVAKKILIGEYLTKEETKFYSINCLQGALSDDHRELPIFGNFNKRIQRFGINLPYPEEYTDLVSMYKILLIQGKIRPVKNFEQYMH